MTVVCRARASYKKLPGLLELTDTHLQWTQDNKKVPSVRVPHADAASLFCSKEGSPQVRLKLGLVGDENGHNFTFLAAQTVAHAERESFKSQLATIISRNRSSIDASLRSQLMSSTPSLTPMSLPSTPRPMVSASRPSTSRAGSVSSDGRSGNDTTGDFRLRKAVLLGNPELASLHRELVMSGQITEAEFWEGREHLLLSQAAAESQRRGRPGQLVDPRPQTTSEGGDPKIVITPQLVHDIFEEYPVVAKAYSENVPNKLSEAEFWKRYFQSKLFDAHRASIRSSATQFVVKGDPIFDKYLEKDDDELEPRRPRNEAVDIFVDLAATLEDHAETGNDKDITMHAGRQRAVLPLIRKFNEHSERLLDSALGSSSSAKRRRLDSDETAFAQFDLDDLHVPEASAAIPLEMQDRERYFEGRMTSQASTADAQSQELDMQTTVLEAKNGLQRWDVNLKELKIDRKAGDAALLSMTQNVASRLEAHSKKNEIPEALFGQMVTCHTAAREFLRQFWFATCPPPVEAQTLAASTPAQRATKAAKMIGYLTKTHEKVDALVRAATAEGVDPKRVDIAMKPILDAVDRALAVHRQPSKKAR